ncbi:hypothetical protein [Terrabacter sp. BE26]|uniref:hypothetical protein n=1 Tax=Terrabacter sp. BE26 TaxID=2898152 RepID=UPI0035BE8A70
MSILDQQRRSSSPAEPEAPGRKVALALGVLGLLVATGAFIVPSPTLTDLCWAVGFGILFVALVVTLVGVVRARGDRLSAAPTSVAGWISLACFLAAVAFAFTPFGEISLALGIVAASLAVGAVTVSRERSVPVITLPLLGGVFVLAFVLGEVLIGRP